MKESLKKLNVRHLLNKNQDQILKKSDVWDLKNKTKELVISKDWCQCFLVSSLYTFKVIFYIKVKKINCKAYPQ